MWKDENKGNGGVCMWNHKKKFKDEVVCLFIKKRKWGLIKSGKRRFLGEGWVNKKREKKERKQYRKHKRTNDRWKKNNE